MGFIIGLPILLKLWTLRVSSLCRDVSSNSLTTCSQGLEAFLYIISIPNKQLFFPICYLFLDRAWVVLTKFLTSLAFHSFPPIFFYPPSSALLHPPFLLLPLLLFLLLFLLLLFLCICHFILTSYKLRCIVLKLHFIQNFKTICRLYFPY